MSLLGRIQKFNRDVKQYTPLCLPCAYGDLFFSALLFGASFDDYIRYRFWEKSLRQRNTFITFLRSKRIIHQMNEKAYRDCFEDKARFNALFGAYLGRRFLSLREASQGELDAFLAETGKVIAKPYNGGEGHGIIALERGNVPTDFYETHRNYVLEEWITQHEAMEKIHPGSVNTVRVQTVCYRGEAKIMAASLRVGRADGCVDNLYSGGICANVHVDLGIVDSYGTNLKREKLLFHPDSGEKLLGFEIPHWGEVKKTVLACAQVVPQIRYVGWDVAITREGCCVIEGNHDPGHDLIQMNDQVGKYPLVVGRK